MNDSTHPLFARSEPFGPTRPGAFDFTLLFEDSILAIAPASLFLVAACVRTVYLHDSPVKVESGYTKQIKVAFLAAFTALELSILLLWAISPGARSEASLAAACLDFVAAITLSILSSYEHARSVAPSTLIAIYLLITIPLDVVRTRTLFILDRNTQTNSIGALLATATTIKLGVLISEAASKRSFLLSRYRHLPPEATSGPFSKSVFWWINPLLHRGYSRILNIKDLYTIDETLSSTSLSYRFQARWNKEKLSSRGLLKTLFMVLRWDLATSGMLRMVLIGLKFAQPFLIQRTIDYIGNRQDQPKSVGWGLTGAYVIVYTSLALITASYNYLVNRLIVKLRGGLVSLVYQKTVDLSITGLEEGAALTLMSTDVERITESWKVIQDTWASIIELVIAIYLLWTRLHLGFLAPAVCFLSAVVAMTVCTKFFPRFMTRWVECIQSRVSFTSTMINSMRSIKLLGLSAIVGTLLQRLRVHENVMARKFRWLLLMRILFQNITTIIAPIATFTVFILQANAAGRPLQTATAYSILSILQLADPPLMLLVASLPSLVASLGCVTRIETFLSSNSRSDHRLFTQSGLRSWQESEEGIELREISRIPADDIVTLKECSFGWSSDHQMLRGINMRVQRGMVLMMIGPTGCGKSTLIKGILGETPSSKGFVYLATKSIGYADQNPWTINSTIKAGICGESPYDDAYYQEVIDCCNLREDLENLPKGDATIVGSKGISLSGGQRQRLALAKAVFARKDILILDDIFSGLDADTEERIFRKLLSRTGLLRRQHTTVILVTHAVGRLAYSDWVVALTKDGTIAEQGTYDTLRSHDGYVSSLAVRFKQSEATELTEDYANAKQPSPENVEVEEEEVMSLFARKTGDWVTYKHYFAAAGWLSTCLAAIWTAIFIMSIKVPGLLVNYFTGPDTTLSSNRWFMIIMGITAVISLVTLSLLVWQTFLDMIPRASNGIHKRLLDTVMMAPLSFFTKTDSGVTLNRFSQDLTLIDNELPGAFIGFMLQTALFLVGAGLMVATATYFLVTIPVVIFALFIIQNYYLRTSRQLRHLDLETKAPLYTHFEETLSGLVTIRAFNWVDAVCAKNLDLLDQSQRPYYLLLCIQHWLGVVLDLVVAALAAILMIIIVSLRHKIDPGLVGLGLLNVMGFSTTLSELVKNWTTMETSLGAIARVRDFVSNTERENEPVECMDPGTEWPASGALRVSNFCASYSDYSELVLNGITLDVRPGEKVGICGRSGSGKSSLLASLLHLLEFRGGSISIDGADIASIPRDVLRQRLNVIPQEPYWISTETVRFNLDPWLAGDQNDTAIKEALSKCQIWDVIEGKGGLDMKMDSDFLSPGQKQLFCLARSLLRKSKLVVLDEVSSSVDIHTDSVMQKVIREEFGDCTIVCVAHRLNTIVDFDRIVVLHGGRIVECDQPQTLLSRSGSRFRELYEI